jgi:hypothetical protein
MRKLLRRIVRMFGDCDRCGHSIIYHLPFIGCEKCDCEEFS